MRYVLAIAALLCAQLTTASEAPDGAREAGLQFAKQLITPVLHNPSSADFDWGSVQVRLAKRLKLDAAAEPTEVAAVQGVVRATNAFNAVVAQKYMVYMTCEDDLWQPIMVMLGDDNVFVSEDGKKLLALVNQEAEKRRAAGMAELQRKNKEEADARAQEKRNVAAYAAGRAAFAPAFARQRWSLAVAKEEGIEKLANKHAANNDACQNDEERQEFVKGFKSAFLEAKKKSTAK